MYHIIEHLRVIFF